MKKVNLLNSVQSLRSYYPVKHIEASQKNITLLKGALSIVKKDNQLSITLALLQLGRSNTYCIRTVLGTNIHPEATIPEYVFKVARLRYFTDSLSDDHYIAYCHEIRIDFLTYLIEHLETKNSLQVINND